MRTSESASTHDRWLILLLVGLCVALYGFELGTRPIWDVDEGMHSSTSRVMVETGDWLVPTYNGENFYDKPALHNWFVAISFTALGFTEFAARLPSALVGLLSALVTFWLGRRMFGSRTGFFGGAVLATSIIFVVMSRTIVHDISLAFFVTLSLALFYIGYTDTEESKRKRHLLLFWVALAFAVLAKGPLGAVLVIPPAFGFLLYKRDLRFLRQMRLGIGIPLFLLLAAPWYVAMCVTQDDYFQKFFIEKHVGGVGGQLFHQHPFYWYIPVLIGGVLPWSFFLPAAVADAARTPVGGARDGIVFTALWCGWTFVLFSAASTKLETYILPMFPGVALLLGNAWDRLLDAERPSERRGFRAAHQVLLVVIAGGLVFLFFFFPQRLTNDYGIAPGPVLASTAGLLAIAVLGWFALRNERPRLYFGSFLAIAGLAIVLFTTVFAPVVNPYRTTAELGWMLEPHLEDGEPLRVFRRLKDSVIFYTGRNQEVLIYWEELDEYFDTDQRVFALIQDEHVTQLDQASRRPYVVARIGDEYAISNQPGELEGTWPIELEKTGAAPRKEPGGE